jgi:precorrin-8X/cobalt-precorrin-8 methylmutase
MTETALRYRYLRDGEAIRRASFAAIEAEAEAGLSRLAPELRAIALRIAHAAGDSSVIESLAASPGAAAAGRAALAMGAPVLVDARMVAVGIAPLPRGNRVIATIGDDAVPALAARLGTTRSGAAVELWRPHLAGAVCAIGNAPTALFHLLELVAGGAPKPALVLGFPVGYVGAAEAKSALAENPLGLPFIALLGRRGGSAMAVASVNALALP